MSEYIRLKANGVDAYPDASTENTYRPNGTSVENALVALESNVTTLGGVAGEAKTLAEQNSVKIATAEQEISAINSSLNVQYNPNTDKIEVLYNGTWVGGLYVGLQFDGTIFNGGFNSKSGINEMRNLRTYNFSVSNSSIYFTGEGDNSCGISYICSATPLSVDIENFKRIRVVGNVRSYSSDTAYAYIGLLPTMPTSKDSFTNDCTFLLGSVKGSLDFDKTIDIPTILKGKKYVGFREANSTNNYGSFVTITQIILLKD